MPSRPLMSAFEHDTKDPDLASISAIFQNLATQIDETLPVNPETNAALRKMLEARDCLLRAARMQRSAVEEQPDLFENPAEAKARLVRRAPALPFRFPAWPHLLQGVKEE